MKKYLITLCERVQYEPTEISARNEESAGQKFNRLLDKHKVDVERTDEIHFEIEEVV